MNNHRVSAIVICAIASTIAQANFQEQSDHLTFSVQEAITFGITHNPILASARARVESSKARLTSARAMEPPIVSIGPSIGGDSATPILTQKLEISGRRGARSNVAFQELQVVQNQFESVERDLTRDIEVAYADVISSQSAVDVAKDVASVIQRIRDSVKKQVDVGQIATAELVKANIELSRAEIETLHAQNTLDRARQAFNVTLGRSAELPVKATDSAPFAVMNGDLSTLLGEALINRPEIAAGDSAVKAAKANVGLQRTDLKPDLELSLLQNTNINRSAFLRPESTGLSLSFVFPLFDTGRIRGRVREAESVVREQESTLATLKIRVTQDVANAFSRVRETEIVLTRYIQEILPGARDLLSKVEFGYGRGASTLLEFLEAQRTYRSTQLEYVAAFADNAKARAELRHAVGQKVTPSAANTDFSTQKFASANGGN